MRTVRRIGAFVLSLMLLLGAALPAAAGQADRETTILFTHDLHSHFLPVATADGGESGGYARLATLLKQERKEHPDALTVDGGDFSIGTLFQTLYTTRGAELRAMGELGFDAVTLGNHEFDHESTGYAKMLQSAAKGGGPLPEMVIANFKPSAENPDQLEIQRAMAAYGVKETMILKRGGVTYGLFGLMGLDADECAPGSGFELEDPVEAARRCVETLEGQGAEFIICLSHSGTDEKTKRSEDEQLAAQVDGLDLIVSGHTHTVLEQPIVVGDTYIVSCGDYGFYLGSITLKWDAVSGEKTLVEYELIPVDQTVREDVRMAEMVDELKDQVSMEYLSRYGMTYDQVLTSSAFPMKMPKDRPQTGNPIGELVSDSFMWAVEHLEKDAPDVPTVAVTARGVLRADLPVGDITTSMAFDVLSMGVGEDGTSGYPLVGVYLTGKELKAAMEVDASVTLIMPAAQLYMSGVEYTFNVNRVPFNRLVDCHMTTPGFSQTINVGLEEIEDDQNYRVITGMYSAMMLGTVKGKSMGLLSMEPKLADGSPVVDYNDCILRDENGNEIKEWYALASYLKSFGADGIPNWYAAADGRKDVSHSLNPIQLLKNINWITFVVLAAALIVILAVVLILRGLIGRLGGNRRYKSRSARRRYRG